MRILNISPTYDFKSGSGVATGTRNICERLVKRGHIVKILTINRERSINVDEVINGVEIKRIGTPGSKYLYGLNPWFSNAQNQFP